MNSTLHFSFQPKKNCQLPFDLFLHLWATTEVKFMSLTEFCGFSCCKSRHFRHRDMSEKSENRNQP